MKLIRKALWITSLLPLVAQAELNVIADLGGQDASPFFAGINPQDPMLSPPVSIRSGEAAVLPVATPELSPGKVVPRSLQLPGIGALCVVGDDNLSRNWLRQNAKTLSARGAVGMVVNVTTAASLAELRALAPGVSLVPVSGSDLARRLKLTHYPLLITDTGLSQRVEP